MAPTSLGIKAPDCPVAPTFLLDSSQSPLLSSPCSAFPTLLSHFQPHQLPRCSTNTPSISNLWGEPLAPRWDSWECRILWSPGTHLDHHLKGKDACKNVVKISQHLQGIKARGQRIIGLLQQSPRDPSHGPLGYVASSKVPKEQSLHPHEKMLQPCTEGQVLHCTRAPPSLSPCRFVCCEWNCPADGSKVLTKPLLRIVCLPMGRVPLFTCPKP